MQSSGKNAEVSPVENEPPSPAGDSAKDEKYIIRAAKKTLEALDLFTGNNSTICVTELQQALGINSNMAFRILYTLERARYIVFNPDTNKYHLSLKVIAMGRTAAASLSIAKIASPYMRLLSAEHRKLNIALLVYENGDLIIADRIASIFLPKIPAHVGRLVPIHASCGGKALISELQDGELDRVVAEKPLESFTDATITDLSELKRELAQIRDSRVAWERGEHIQGLNGIATAIRNREDRAIAALALTGFENYVTIGELESLAGKLHETAYQISEAVHCMQ